MAFKFNISDKGKAWKAEAEAVSLVGKSVGDKIEGKEIKPELEGYELEISGASDTSGFPLAKDVEGSGLRKKLLTRGFGMRDNRDGMRLKKTLRGKVIAETTSQINLKVLKEGHKKLHELFPEQNKPKEKKVVPAVAGAAAPAEAKK
jgi:small subunit ribosomal protein S6e